MTQGGLLPPPSFDNLSARFQCMSDCGYATDPVWGPVMGAAGILSVVCALVYGLALAGRRPSVLRTAVKTIPVAGLAVLALLWGSPWQMTAALAACAVGDAFLSRDPDRWLPWGLVAFLAGHAFYIALFARYADPLFEADVIHQIGWGVTALFAVVLLAFVWRHVGVLRPAVVLYAAVISVMVGASLRLSPGDWPAMVGAVLFLLSDAILAISLFRGEVLFGSTRLTNWAVWFLYYAAQHLILGRFIGLTP